VHPKISEGKYRKGEYADQIRVESVQDLMIQLATSKSCDFEM